MQPMLISYHELRIPQKMNRMKLNSEPIHMQHIFQPLIIYAFSAAAALALTPLGFDGLSALTGFWLLRMAEALATASLRRSGR